MKPNEVSHYPADPEAVFEPASVTGQPNEQQVLDLIRKRLEKNPEWIRYISEQKIRLYSANQAMCIAKLWDAGKCIGGDENEVIFALMDEVDRLRAMLREQTNEAK